MTPKPNGKAIGEVVPGDMRSKSEVRSKDPRIWSVDKVGKNTIKYAFASNLIIKKMKIYKAIFIPADTYSIVMQDVKKP